ncbi:MAG: gliding motility-associated C-terminal domain-containing protein [Flavobacteriales bacterium]|nr:gliding motility-associated C-terminal domain-containing protein [Flavobacteriales bacterium]
MKHKFFISILIAATQAFGQYDPVELHCIKATQPTGASLEWQIPPDPLGHFDSYKVYRSSDNVNYSLVGTVNNYLQNNFADAAASTQNQSYYYYIIVEYFDGTTILPSVPSDTLQSIFLEVNNSNPQDGFAHLLWNKIHDPKLGTHPNNYDVERKYYFTGVWSIIATPMYGSEFYDDVDKVCIDSNYYSVNVTDAYGCVSHSNQVVKQIIDKTPPEIPVIDSASVDPLTGEITISWTVSKPGDIGGYLVIRDGIVIDTVFGNVDTFYVDQNANAENESQSYGISSFDTCWNVNPTGPNVGPTDIIHESMWETIIPQTCENALDINWNAYKEWPLGVSEYDIYVQSGATFNKVSSTGGTTFKFENANPGQLYCFYVRAKENGGVRTASSNLKCDSVETFKKPNFNYLKSVSVNTSNEVEIKWTFDTNSETDSIIILRSEDGSVFDEITALKASSGNLTYIDRSARPDLAPQYYKVVTTDQCKRPLLTSNLGRTVYISGKANQSAIMNQMEWTEYLDWDTLGNGVESYDLWRSIDDGTFHLVENVDNNQKYYQDDVEQYMDTEGEFCYYVIAYESAGNQFGTKETSTSNVFCLAQKHNVYLPKAFTPNDDVFNQEFKPISSFLEEEGYSFEIFNRWGDKVFETSDPQSGWDGNKAPLGVYLYSLKYKNDEGEEMKQKGSFTLLR